MTESRTRGSADGRSTRESLRVSSLDGFRAYAILGVVAVHLLGASGVIARTGGTDAGVVLWSILGNSIDAFFIISAFVLFLPTIRSGGDFGRKRDFWVGRGSRLLPAYWLVIAFSLLLITIRPPTPDFPFPPLTEIAAHALVLQMPAQFLDTDFAIGFAINGPLWMISIVVGFYLVLPFVARSYARHPLIGLAAAAAITIVWKEAIDSFPAAFGAISNGPEDYVRLLGVDQLPGWAFSFGLGMTGAWAYVWARHRYSNEQLARASLRAAPVVLLAYAVACFIYGRTSLTELGNIGPISRSDTFATILNSASRAALIGVVIIGPSWLQRPFDNRITTRLAELSYGVYLIHYLLIIYAVALLNLPNDGSLIGLAVWFAVILPPSLVYAALSRRYLELPVLRWVRLRYPSRRRSAAAAIQS